jgi:hypothetical protein
LVGSGKDKPGKYGAGADAPCFLTIAQAKLRGGIFMLVILSDLLHVLLNCKDVSVWFLYHCLLCYL